MRRLLAACLITVSAIVVPQSAFAGSQPIILQTLPGDDFTIVAAAPTADVLTNTGDGTNATHIANGTGWYYSDNYSWGFVKAGDQVDRRWCDAGGILDGWANVNARLCWHTAGGRLQAGWSAGPYRVSSTQVPPAYRAIYVSDTPSWYPYGPSGNVSQATIAAGGWSLCFSSLYRAVTDGHPEDIGDGTPMDQIRTACHGKFMLLGGMSGPNNWTNASPTIQMPGTSHWYRYVPDRLDWDVANSQAGSQAFDGAAGHLVTITSQSEADFVRAVSGPANIWLGARALESGAARDWTWVAGKEKGIVFTSCAGDSAESCTVPVGTFAPWSTGDPNNSRIEDAAIVANRSWGGGRWPAVIGGWGSCMIVQNWEMGGYGV